MSDTRREHVEIRGIEREPGFGKVDVVRWLCPACLRYFGTPELADRHACAPRPQPPAPRFVWQWGDGREVKDRDRNRETTR